MEGGEKERKVDGLDLFGLRTIASTREGVGMELARCVVRSIGSFFKLYHADSWLFS